MPKPNKSAASRDVDSIFRTPYPLHAPAKGSKPNGPAKDTQTSIENMIQMYMKAHNKIVQDVKQSQLEIIKKAQQKTKAICEKDEQCTHLTQELTASQGEVKQLLLKVEEVKQNEESLSKKWQALFSKYTEMEKGYDLEINNAKITLDQQKSKIDEQEMRIAEQEAQITNLQNSKQALYDQLNGNITAQKNQIQNLELNKFNLQEEVQLLSAELESLRQERDAQLTLNSELKMAYSNLKLTVEESECKIEEVIKRRELELKEAEHNKKLLENKEMECQKLMQQNEQLLIDLKGTREKINSDLKAHKEEMDKLYNHNQSVTKTYLAEEKCYQDKIKQLEEQLTNKNQVQNAQVEEISQLTIEVEHLVKFNNDIEMSAKKLKEEKSKMQEELNLKEEKLNALQEKVIRKNKELAELERKKNATIAELKYKMNKIGTVFSQSVGSAAIFHETIDYPESKAPKKPLNDTVQPFNKSEKTSGDRPSSFAVPIPSTSPQSQCSSGTGKEVVINMSDFNEETSDDDFQQGHQTKQQSTKKRAIKTRSPQSDIFDKLKTSVP